MLNKDLLNKGEQHQKIKKWLTPNIRALCSLFQFCCFCRQFNILNFTVIIFSLTVLFLYQNLTCQASLSSPNIKKDLSILWNLLFSTSLTNNFIDKMVLSFIPSPSLFFEYLLSNYLITYLLVQISISYSLL